MIKSLKPISKQIWTKDPDRIGIRGVTQAQVQIYIRTQVWEQVWEYVEAPIRSQIWIQVNG